MFQSRLAYISLSFPELSRRPGAPRKAYHLPRLFFLTPRTRPAFLQALFQSIEFEKFQSGSLSHLQNSDPDYTNFEQCGYADGPGTITLLY